MHLHSMMLPFQCENDLFWVIILIFYSKQSVHAWVITNPIWLEHIFQMMVCPLHYFLHILNRTFNGVLFANLPYFLTDWSSYAVNCYLPSKMAMDMASLLIIDCSTSLTCWYWWKPLFHSRTLSGKYWIVISLFKMAMGMLMLIRANPNF